MPVSLMLVMVLVLVLLLASGVGGRRGDGAVRVKSKRGDDKKNKSASSTPQQHPATGW